jgi:hypothetical protein
LEFPFHLLRTVDVKVEVLGNHAVARLDKVVFRISGKVAQDGKDDSEAFKRLVSRVKGETLAREAGHVAAGLVVLLQKENAFSLAREISRSHLTGKSGTNHDYIICRHGLMIS